MIKGVENTYDLVPFELFVLGIRTGVIVGPIVDAAEDNNPCFVGVTAKFGKWPKLGVRVWSFELGLSFGL
jgi:hypothetical protein